MGRFFTRSGVALGFGEAEFQVDHVRIEDIADHLGMLNRFGGAGQRFYSVLRHVLLVAEGVPPALRRVALLHDAAEAYLGDVVSPLKARLPEFRAIEEHFTRTIFAAFELPLPGKAEAEALREADRRALAAESYLIGPPGLWEELGSRRDERFEGMLRGLLDLSDGEARRRFLGAFEGPPGSAP